MGKPTTLTNFPINRFCLEEQQKIFCPGTLVSKHYQAHSQVFKIAHMYLFQLWPQNVAYVFLRLPIESLPNQYYRIDGTLQALIALHLLYSHRFVNR